MNTPGTKPANPFKPTQARTTGFTVKRPLAVGGDRRQAVIIARDASTSMAGEKAREASEYVQRLVVELAQPFNKDAFDIAIVDFDHQARVAHALTRATALKMQSIATGGDGTDIAGALAQAETLARSATGEKYIRPVILIFTDGQHNTGGDPHGVADRLRSLADVVTVGIGDGADEVMLEKLATTPRHFYRCTDGAQLRAFLAEVGQTIETTRARNSAATQALGQIKQ